jgi:hypothetical protein
LSINRFAAVKPSPAPVCDQKLGLNTAGKSAIPGPVSQIRIRKIWGDSPSTMNSTLPPPAYLKALRAISETAVAMRVCAWESNPSHAAI